jgi:DNA polymerase I
VPLRDSDTGALTKYFGKVAGKNEYKYRGIECRQRSTPSYIDDAQKALIRAVDAYRDPEAVCGELQSWIDRLERGAVDPNELVTTVGSSQCCQRSRQAFP